MNQIFLITLIKNFFLFKKEFKFEYAYKIKLSAHARILRKEYFQKLSEPSTALGLPRCQSSEYYTTKGYPQTVIDLDLEIIKGNKTELILKFRPQFPMFHMKGNPSEKALSLYRLFDCIHVILSHDIYFGFSSPSRAKLISALFFAISQ